MFKVILKTALKTLLVVLLLAAVGFAIASLGFPKSMASYFEKCGNYSMAAAYSSLSYSYSGDADDLNRCVQDNIEAGNDRNVSAFGDELLSRDDFSQFCERKSGELKFDYRQYICGRIAVAKYRLGNFDGAISLVNGAMSFVNFPSQNAMVQLVLAVREKGNKPDGERLLAEVEKLKPTEEEQPYYEMVKNILAEFIK